MDAADLYRLPPEGFTAARDAAAKQAKAEGDPAAAKELKALRRPSVAAWLVNVLVAHEPALLEQLLELGPALAQAQSAGEGDALRELGAQRRALVGAVVDRAVALADRSVTAAVRDEVAVTLEAGLSDPASADAVRSGRLVRALSYAGFGGVDLAGAVAAPRGPTTKRSRKKEEDPVPAAEAAALEAAGALDDAVRACERLTVRADAAEQEARVAAERVEQARAALQAAAQAYAGSAEQAHRAREESAAAVDAVRTAQQREEQARTALDRLRRTHS